MAQDVIMPKWGLTMKEGKVVRWLKGEGETVEAGEPLFEVETDKITNSVEAPASGVLAKIIVPEGDVAVVQSVVAVIAAPGENVEAGASESTADAVDDAAAPAAATEDRVDSKTEKSFVRAMPAARRLARELHVDLSMVTATGSGGRITMKDVQTAADAVPDGVNASPKAIEFARKQGVDLTLVSGTGEGGRITKADILRAMNPVAEQTAVVPLVASGETVIPMEGVRQLIAENMQGSLQNAAQLTVFVELDVTEMVQLRTRLLERNKRDAQYRLSYNDIIAYAVCRALKRHPVMNSTLQEDGVHLHEHVNLGIAVSIPNGLIVPNVKQADTYGLEALKTEVRDVAGRARDGGLNMDEISGGTFTISNVSMLGMDGFTPILNPPETGILGVGRVVEKPAVHDGEICIRQMMTLSLTFNHMATDGAPAMTFLRELGDMLEHPGLMIV
ncbi:2-oxo acid dehydrogenase subunit E2 [Pseudodesulfovibrio sp. JC047]|uniref:dihydrolipoamide acetyltransferase family protein n=1 Tax=Pseudodesulfovibrio sp. JC047 TaxID=2683199 RepID=UPI0013D6D027|nr:dihydrolipoamide acetyltransferase family protein [Pseudodesulfovibrio sp. JC047]NDV19465.1 2-oxo acid dehydrogenase subunit E2 [Pseudodesulfovibrio sp. JC047]